jgi:2-phosphoglycerate kinase
MSDSKHKLENVFWLGGSPCAGKSSISEILASRFGVDVYHVDEAFNLHAQQFDPIRQPTLTKWLASSCNQRWMQPVDTLVRNAIGCYQEHFTMILEDVLSRPERPLLVEGTALLPKEVASLLTHWSHAIWVIPTTDFQRAHYPKRDWAQGVVAQCTNPEAAFLNWMERDTRFAKWIEAEASGLHLPVLKVDGNRTIEENAEAVARQLQLV